MVLAAFTGGEKIRLLLHDTDEMINKVALVKDKAENVPMAHCR